MALLVRKSVLLAKVETSEGVDVTPGTGDAVLLRPGANLRYPSEMIDRPLLRSSISILPPVKGRTYAELSFSVEVKGSGAAGTAPDIGVLFRGCGMLETITPATSVVYTPASSGHKSLSMYYYIDGLLYKLLGARGTFNLEARVGQLLVANFRFIGKPVAQADAALPAATYESTTPEAMMGVGFSIDSYAAILSNWAMDVGNELTPMDDMNATTGYGSFIIGARNPTTSFDPEAVLGATKDFFSMWDASSVVTQEFTVGATAGNIVSFESTGTVLREFTHGERTTALTFPLSGSLASTAGDTEFSLSFT